MTISFDPAEGGMVQWTRRLRGWGMDTSPCRGVGGAHMNPLPSMNHSLYPCHEDDARGGTRCPQGKPGALPTVAGSLLRR
jgi:hypothetical protein